MEKTSRLRKCFSSSAHPFRSSRLNSGGQGSSEGGRASRSDDDDDDDEYEVVIMILKMILIIVMPMLGASRNACTHKDGAKTVNPGAFHPKPYTLNRKADPKPRLEALHRLKGTEADP